MDIAKVCKNFPSILLDPHQNRDFISKKQAWAISIIFAIPLGIPHIISAAIRSRSKIPVQPNETHAKIREIWGRVLGKKGLDVKPPLKPDLTKTAIQDQNPPVDTGKKIPAEEEPVNPKEDIPTKSFHGEPVVESPVGKISPDLSAAQEIYENRNREHPTDIQALPEKVEQPSIQAGPAQAEPIEEAEDSDSLPELIDIPDEQVSSDPMQIIYEVIDLAKMHRNKSDDSGNIANLLGKLIRKVEQTGLNFVEFVQDEAVRDVMSEDGLLKQVLAMHEAMMRAAEKLSTSQVARATPEDLKKIRSELAPLSLRHFSYNPYALAILFKNDGSRSIIEEYVKQQQPRYSSTEFEKPQIDALDWQLVQFKSIEKGKGVSDRTLFLFTLANQVVDLVKQFPNKSMVQDNIAELMGAIAKNLEGYGSSLSELLADRAIQVFAGNRLMGEVIQLHEAMMSAAEKLIEMTANSDLPVEKDAENIQKFLRAQSPRLSLRLFSYHPDALDIMFKNAKLRSAILFYIKIYKDDSSGNISEEVKTQLGVLHEELMEHAARSISTYFKDDVLVDALKNKDQTNLVNILIAIKQRIEPLPIKDFLKDSSANKVLAERPLLYRVARLLSRMDMEEQADVPDKDQEAARLARQLAEKHANEPGLATQLGLRDKGDFPDINVENLQNDAEFKKLYRQLAMKYHPDKGGDPEKFKQLKNLQELVAAGKFKTYLKSLEKLRKKPE